MNNLKTATNQPNPILKWLRIKLLTSHLKETLKFNTVLDLCCGWGFYFQINPNAWGVELDDECIEYLTKKGLKVKKANILKSLPFPDSNFELVIAHDALEHFVISETKQILENVFRVLKPSGKFMIVVPNKKGYDFGIKTKCGHKHYLIPEEIVDLSREKFTLLKAFPHPFPRFIGQHFTHNKEVVYLQKKGY